MQLAWVCLGGRGTQLSRRALSIAIVIITAVGGVLLGRATAPDPAVEQLRAGVAAAQVVRAAAAETVTVYVPIAAASKARSDSADQLVAIASDTMLSVRLTPAAAPTMVVVPIQVTEDLTQLRQTISDQARAIAALQAHVAADSVVIRRQDSLIVAQRGPRCGAKCGGAVGGTFVLLLGLMLR